MSAQGKTLVNWCAATFLPLAVMLAAGQPARADVASAANVAFSASSVEARGAALAELEAARPGDPLASYAAGAIEFFAALERLGQGLHRHGFDSPRSMVLPLMRLPVPENPNPQPLTYEGFRAILSEFRDGMAEAILRLGEIPASADIGVEVDLTKLGIDLDANGSITPLESAAAIMAALNQNAMEPPAPGSLVFRFDRADGYWLQGYANVLMAHADFWLAHDFRAAFDQSFHVLFPRAGLPMQEALVPKDENDIANYVAAEWRLVDVISFVHLVNWPVVEPERRKAARDGLLEMIRLSRENWKAIRAETDNDREWLPGPQQKGIHALTGLEVDEATVAAWHGALAMAEDVLEGRSLIPHFRILQGGINMKRFFEDTRPFDLVLMITGPAIVPYIEQGKVLTAQEFDAMTRQFGDAGFATYALWFN